MLNCVSFRSFSGFEVEKWFKIIVAVGLAWENSIRLRLSQATDSEMFDKFDILVDH